MPASMSSRARRQAHGAARSQPGDPSTSHQGHAEYKKKKANNNNNVETEK